MAKRSRGKGRAAKQVQFQVSQKVVPSLLDAMEDGNEYGSIVSLIPKGFDTARELARALEEIERVRKRPCLCYVANLMKRLPNAAIEASDHLPFNEMVSRVPQDERKVDVLLVTPGRSAEQVNLFVEALRQRFDDVQFIIPYKAMSAGTLWALSGDALWMGGGRGRRGFRGVLRRPVSWRL